MGVVDEGEFCTMNLYETLFKKRGKISHYYIMKYGRKIKDGSETHLEIRFGLAHCNGEPRLFSYGFNWHEKLYGHPEEFVLADIMLVSKIMDNWLGK